MACSLACCQGIRPARRPTGRRPPGGAPAPGTICPARGSDMKLGMHCNRFTWPGGPAAMGRTLIDIARRMEDARFDSMSVMDHFFQIQGVGPPELEMNEAYTTLGFVAGATERLRLGAIVTGVTYREPAFLV